MSAMKNFVENAAIAYQKNNPNKSFEEAMNHVCSSHTTEYWENYVRNNLEPSRVK